MRCKAEGCMRDALQGGLCPLCESVLGHFRGVARNRLCWNLCGNQRLDDDRFGRFCARCRVEQKKSDLYYAQDGRLLLSQRVFFAVAIGLCCLVDRRAESLTKMVRDLFDKYGAETPAPSLDDTDSRARNKTHANTQGGHDGE